MRVPARIPNWSLKRVTKRILIGVLSRVPTRFAKLLRVPIRVSRMTPSGRPMRVPSRVPAMIPTGRPMRVPSRVTSGRPMRVPRRLRVGRTMRVPMRVPSKVSARILIGFQ